MAQINSGVIIPLFRKISEGFQKIFIPADHIILTDNETVLQDRLDFLKNTPVMSVCFNTGDTDISGAVDLTLNTLLQDTSNGLLTQSSGGIQIGTGVKTVLISSSTFAWCSNNINSYLWTHITRVRSGTTFEAAINIAGVTQQGYVSSVIPPISLDVQEGDIIKLGKKTSESIRVRGSRNTWLTVQVIEIE